jgi:hypothetical protein
VVPGGASLTQIREGLRLALAAAGPATPPGWAQPGEARPGEARPGEAQSGGARAAADPARR